MESFVFLAVFLDYDCPYIVHLPVPSENAVLIVNSCQKFVFNFSDKTCSVAIIHFVYHGNYSASEFDWKKLKHFHDD
uniref:Uncharacterized protein n=1 Tax=Panagrolaimus sp. JU765 TaxID=591449 RepID=A0AC34QKM1_9BILA